MISKSYPTPKHATLGILKARVLCTCECESLDVHHTVSIQHIPHDSEERYIRFKALTWPQSQTAWGCSGTGAACWQWSLTSFSTRPSQSCSAPRGILLQSSSCATSSGERRYTQVASLVVCCFSAFMCVCVLAVFVLLSGVCSKATSNTSQWMRKLHWSVSCEGEERFSFRFDCHTMILNSANTDIPLRCIHTGE